MRGTGFAATAAGEGVPIRLRLTVTFAGAMILLLAAAGLFVYLRLRADLDESIDAGLRARWSAAAELIAASGRLDGFPIEDLEEGFVQLIGPDGVVVGGAGRADRVPLTDEELATRASITVERPVAGLDGIPRILVVPVDAGLLVVGQSLAARDEPLADLVVSFLVGGPLAVVAASMLGYGLARAGLAPVDAIQTTAADISKAGDGRRLPVPDTRDEIQRLAVTLNQMIDRLERSFERERRFVADASHELRTPIAVVKTELEAALLAGDHGPVVGEALRAAVDELDDLAQLAEDLLVIARTSESGLPLARQAIPVDSLLEDVRTRFVDRAGRHGRSIRLEGGGGIQAMVDPMRLRQALANLVDNALRHGRGDVTMRAFEEAGWVHLEVADEGAGFPEDLRDPFERFARGEQGRSETGSGLGLSIVLALAEAHGGTAEIRHGKPTTVRITIPALR